MSVQSVATRNASPRLVRSLTMTHAVLYGLGVTIGAGIYVCSSSDNLRLIRHFEKGGSGSSGLEFKRPAVGAASGGLRWWPA